MKEFFTSWSFWKPAIGVIVGGFAGFLYYFFVGCNSGGCAITGSPINSILWGAAMGFLLTNSFSSGEKSQK